MGYERPKVPKGSPDPYGLAFLVIESARLDAISRISKMPEYVEYLGEHKGYQLVGEYSRLYGGNKNFGVQVLRYNNKDTKERVFWKAVMEDEQARNILKNWDVSQIQSVTKFG